MTELFNQAELEYFKNTTQYHRNQRQAVAHELHDNLGILLASLRKNLEVAQPKPNYFDHLLNMIDQACMQTRLLSYQLQHGDAAQVGLPGALNALVRSANRSALGPEVRLFVGHGMGSFPGPIEEGVFSMARQLLQNAFAHASATHIEMQLLYDAWENMLYFSVEDDGVGFSPENYADAPQKGINKVIDTAKTLGGHAYFDTGKGAGTTVHIHLPLGLG